MYCMCKCGERVSEHVPVSVMLLVLVLKCAGVYERGVQQIVCIPVYVF